MFFRLRQYKVSPGKTEKFNAFFLERLLPVQQCHGAKLVGRWQTEDGSCIFALWVYDSAQHYKTVQEKVSSDPDALEAQAFRKREPDPLFTEKEDFLLTSTVPFSLTELAHLDE
jgi:hypothetical protein